MFPFKILPTIALSVMPSFLAAEVTIENLWESVLKAGSGETDEEATAVVYQSIEDANAAQLFYAAAVEGYKDKPNQLKGIGYLLAGQVRSGVDMIAFAPITDEDQELVAQLYGLVYYYFGGAGEDSVYRDPTKSDRILANLRDYSPRISKSYNPGWNSSSDVTQEQYEALVAETRAGRISQLENYIRLMSNEEYFTLSQELGPLQDRNPQGFDANTEDGRRATEIMNRMREISGDPPIPGTSQ